MKREDCPYNCKNGRLFNEGLQQLAPCPHCTKAIRVVLDNEDERQTLLSRLAIPPTYTEIRAVDEELFNSEYVRRSFSSESTHRVASVMKRINGDIYNQRVPHLSAYFFATNRIDLRPFVFGAQKMALEKALGVVPLISVNTLYGLQKAGDFNHVAYIKEGSADYKAMNPETLLAYEGYRFVQQSELSYYDYIHADVCFLEATANTLEKGWTALADLLGERARRGLPTYVLGYWSARGGNFGAGSRGLRYLVQSEHAPLRMDMLLPVELVGKGKDNANGAVMTMDDVGSTKSTGIAGLSLGQIMGTS